MSEHEAHPIDVAIAALTKASQEKRPIGAGTPAEHSEPVDFGEIACHVLTAVAANAGGVEELLAGRPGSWEADYVRQIVHSTAGEDPNELLRWRTTPIRVPYLEHTVLDHFGDFGIETLYEEDAQHAGQAATDLEDALFDAVATEAEKAAHAAAATEAEAATAADNFERNRAAFNDAIRIYDTVRARAKSEGHPLVTALNDAVDRSDAIEKLWESDIAAYTESYLATMRSTLDERGIRAPIEVSTDSAIYVEEIVDELHQAARNQTPLPMTGQAPDWTDGTPADALRRAGLTYLERIDANTAG